MSVHDIVPDPSAPVGPATPAAPSPDPAPCELATDDLLENYLHRRMTLGAMHTTRGHLDVCERCWARWNRHRWDAAENHPLHAQLAEFLGSRFQPYYDSSKALAAEWDAADPRTEAEVADFFRSSLSYLVNLTIWEASGNRPPYATAALPIIGQHDIHTILDIGSGIGSDAIVLRHNGFTVTGCDYRSPSTQFMHFRTGESIAVVEPSELPTVGVPDALWIIDTIDHIANIDRSLGPLLAGVRLMITEDLTRPRQHGRQRFHHRRPHGELAELFGAYGLKHVGNDGICQTWARTTDTPNPRLWRPVQPGGIP